MENSKNGFYADLSLELPGLDQKFYLYREQIGRHISGISDRWYRPTYEAVYWSETIFDQGGKYSLRSASKLIFESSANETEHPLRVYEMLSAVPADMLKYLAEVLRKEPAVVTFRNAGKETAFTVNFDKSELWQQEESECDAVCQAQDEGRVLSPYIIIRDGRAESILGSRQIDLDRPLCKGIFWLIKTRLDEENVVTVKVPCDLQGHPQIPVVFSSKSGENFNHQAEWDKLPPKVTQGKTFDYFPRGRVEIKNGKVTVYCHPDFTQPPYRDRIIDVFGIPIESRFVADGSAHYKAKEYQ